VGRSLAKEIKRSIAAIADFHRISLQSYQPTNICTSSNRILGYVFGLDIHRQ